VSIDKSIAVTGDSMSREAFYGIVDALTKREQDYSDKLDIHWTSDDGHTTMDLWRSNFALQLAHSIDAIYTVRVIGPSLSSKDKLTKQSIDAIHKMCRVPRSDRRWLCCQIKDAPKNIALFVGGAAAWEPRAYVGLYGYYTNEVTTLPC
jgi:hypothetical protein